MSRTVACVLATAFVVGIMPALAEDPCVQPPAGAVSWWPGDGAATDILDGNGGTLMNGAAFATGKVGQGFMLNGVNQYVTVPSNAGLVPGVSSFSLEAWVRTSSGSGRRRIATTYECGGAVCGSPLHYGSLYSLYLLNGFPVFDLRDSTGDTSQVQSLLGHVFLADSTFHHVVATRDMSSLTMTLYVDGRLDSSAPLLPHSQGPIQQDDSETDPFTIGAAVMSGSTALQDFFSGVIDEVIFYQRASSRCEAWRAFEAGAAGHCKSTADGDTDGIADSMDNCPGISNPTQDDQDADGVGDACDCAPMDPGTAKAPEEIRSLGSEADRNTLDWCPSPPLAGSGTVYDVPRGSLDELPVGNGASETCLPPGSFSTSTATDPAIPQTGRGFWYLVRGRNSCGTGTYGFQGRNGAPVVERLPSVCP